MSKNTVLSVQTTVEKIGEKEHKCESTVALTGTNKEIGVAVESTVEGIIKAAKDKNPVLTMAIIVHIERALRKFKEETNPVELLLSGIMSTLSKEEKEGINCDECTDKCH